MLVRSQTESALVDFGNFTKTSLEFPSRFVLDTSVLDEDCDVVLIILPDRPAKMIYVAFKGIRTGWGELEAEAGLYFTLEVVKAHTINRVLQASILHQGSESNHVDVQAIGFTFRLSVKISEETMLEEHSNSLGAVPVVPLG